MSEERKYYTNELTENYSLSIICLKCQLVYPSVSNVGLGGADSVSPNLAVKKKKKNFSTADTIGKQLKKILAFIYVLACYWLIFFCLLSLCYLKN